MDFCFYFSECISETWKKISALDLLGRYRQGFSQEQKKVITTMSRQIIYGNLIQTLKQMKQNNLINIID